MMSKQFPNQITEDIFNHYVDSYNKMSDEHKKFLSGMIRSNKPIDYYIAMIITTAMITDAACQIDQEKAFVLISGPLGMINVRVFYIVNNMNSDNKSKFIEEINTWLAEKE